MIQDLERKVKVASFKEPQIQEQLDKILEKKEALLKEAADATAAEAAAAPEESAQPEEDRSVAKPKGDKPKPGAEKKAPAKAPKQVPKVAKPKMKDLAKAKADPKEDAAAAQEEPTAAATENPGIPEESAEVTALVAEETELRAQLWRSGILRAKLKVINLSLPCR